MCIHDLNHPAKIYARGRLSRPVSVYFFHADSVLTDLCKRHAPTLSTQRSCLARAHHMRVPTDYIVMRNS